MIRFTLKKKTNKKNTATLAYENELRQYKREGEVIGSLQNPGKTC